MDSFMMRGLDALDSIPNLVLLILIKLFFDKYISGNQDFLSLLVALSLMSWMGVARMVRAEVLQLKHMPFVESAKGLGIPHLKS